MPIAALASSSDAVQKASRYAGSVASDTVESAIRQASARTGVDFSYLMEKAAVESSFRTDLKSSSSSATGLYQFIDSTWLNTLKAHGAANGLGQYADAIQTRGDGRSYVADPEMRQKIMDLRKDPKVSALMAAEFTKDNKEYLEKNTAGAVGSTELYLAHFLGAGGASKFLNAMRANPNQTGADVFPEAAASNSAVFYNKGTGQATTLKQIYDRFAKRFSEDGADVAPAVAVARRIEGGMPGGFETQVMSNTGKSGFNNPLSIYQVLALNALETPDEVDLIEPSEAERQRNGGNVKGRDKNGKVRFDPVRTNQNDNGNLGLGLGRAGGVATRAISSGAVYSGAAPSASVAVNA